MSPITANYFGFLRIVGSINVDLWSQIDRIVDMAIIGTLINKISAASFAAAANGAPSSSFATHVHSLPSVPQTVLPIATSVGAVGGNGYAATPKLMACGANASLVTIGLAMGSGVTVPLVAYDLTAIVWHSSIN